MYAPDPPLPLERARGTAEAAAKNWFVEILAVAQARYLDQSLIGHAAVRRGLNACRLPPPCS